MDNISRRNSNEDTTTSMYLSFDAESTISTACYKTLEAMSDTSNLSIDTNVSTRDIQTNKTLEMHMYSQNISPLETVKKKPEILDVKINTPLKALPKNILREYKALCSTPSKEHLLKTVDMTRGSDASRCVDLGLAFIGIDDEKPAFFPAPNLCANEENKENVLPDIEEVSTLSTCSSVETVTSLIERKICSMSIIGSVPEAESVNKMQITENVGECINTNNKLLEKCYDCKNITEDKNCDPTEIKMEDVEATPKSNNDNSIETKIEKKPIVEGLENEEKLKPLGTKVEKKSPVKGLENKGKLKALKTKLEKKSLVERVENEGKVKPQIAVLKQRTRLSVCEPNLQTSKPSRILNSNNNRRSLLPTSKKSMTNINAEIEIPLLINKMLKITDKSEKAVVSTDIKTNDVNQSSETDGALDKRRDLISTLKSRTSLLTSTASNKRPFSFTQRMSVVVKTTLNSPARKIARKSVLSSALQANQRIGNATPLSINPTDSSKFQAGQSSLRRSMVPRSTGDKVKTQPNLGTLPSLQETLTKNTNISSQRKSLYPSSNSLEKEKLPHRKPDILYTCNVCKEQFRIKSLLDAHKRSHESDNSPPAFIKKPSAIKPPSSGSANQCKYCDKKFALIKALHIHLLQNCPKIPPSEKRKLQYTDLNHVEKAQLPVFPNHNLQTAIVKTSCESLNEKKDSHLKASVNGNNATASQTSTHKLKKISAHAGVYRTPSKAVPCHLCKLTFKSILDYTDHNLTSHGNNKTGAVNGKGENLESNQV